MAKEENIFDIIDRYLQGKMSDVESTSFEKELATSEGLQALVNDIVVSNSILYLSEASDIKKDLSLIRQKDIKTKKLIRIAIWIGSILTALVFTLFFMSKSDKNEVLSLKSKNTKTENYSKKETQVTEIIGTDKKVPFTTEIKEKHASVLDSKHKEVILVEDLAILPSNNEMENVEEVTHSSLKESIPFEQKEPDLNVKKDTATNIDPCLSTQILANIKTKSTNKDANNGSIIVEAQSISGGKSPYKFRLNSRDFGNSYSFYNLNKGSYSLTISDANGCMSEILTSTVTENSCLNSYQKTFSPKNNESWTIPFDQESENEARLSIRNEGGKIVFDKNLNTFENNIWDGLTNEGQFVSLGIYHWTINYTDGETCTGYVTVFE